MRVISVASFVTNIITPSRRRECKAGCVGQIAFALTINIAIFPNKTSPYRSGASQARWMRADPFTRRDESVHFNVKILLRPLIRRPKESKRHERFRQRHERASRGTRDNDNIIVYKSRLAHTYRANNITGSSHPSHSRRYALLPPSIVIYVVAASLPAAVAAIREKRSPSFRHRAENDALLRSANINDDESRGYRRISVSLQRGLNPPAY